MFIRDCLLRPLVIFYIKTKRNFGQPNLHWSLVGLILTQILFSVQVVLAANGHISSNKILELENGKISFLLPNSWEILHSFKMIQGGHTISAATPKTSTVTFEIYTKQELGKKKLSLNDFVSDYNRKSNAFKKLTTKHSKPNIGKVKRGQYVGVKETAELFVTDIDMSYIREFYQLSINDNVVFVVFDANKNEYAQFTKDFTTLLDSIKYN